MRVRELAHVVLKIADLDRSLAFYRDTLGLPVAQITRLNGRRIAFFRIGSKHHDFAMMEFPGMSRDDQSHAGVLHIAFNIGDQDDLDALRDAKARVEAAGYEVSCVLQHTVTLSLYLEDPDGITVELFVDRDPAVYREMAEYLGASTSPLAL
jgi:catechol 2,3-dioxygenase